MLESYKTARCTTDLELKPTWKEKESFIYKKENLREGDRELTGGTTNEDPYSLPGQQW